MFVCVCVRAKRLERLETSVNHIHPCPPLPPPNPPPSPPILLCPPNHNSPGDGNFRRILSSDLRPGLGEFKAQLVKALQDKGVVEKEGDTLTFLRTGYKTSTWWEEEREAASDIFRR